MDNIKARALANFISDWCERNRDDISISTEEEVLYSMAEAIINWQEEQPS